jgi:hypothetical protein
VSPRRTLISIIAALLLLCVQSAAAQEVGGIRVRFAGQIEAVNGTTLVLSALSINIGQASIDSALQPGASVVVEGVLMEDGSIVAQTVTLYGPAPAVASPVLMPTATFTPVFVIVPPPTLIPIMTFTPAPPAAPSPQERLAVMLGPVDAVERSSITMYGTVIQVDPDNPVVQALRVGDVVRVEGGYVNGTIVAVSISRIDGDNSNSTAVVVEGEVRRVRDHDIRVGNTDIQLPDNGNFPDVERGDSVRVEGYYDGNDRHADLIATNITITNRAEAERDDDHKGDD